MLIRVAAAAVGLAVILPAIIYGGELAVEILVPFFMLIVLQEYATMAFPDDRNAAFGWLTLGSAGVYVPWIYGDAVQLPPAVAAVVLLTMVLVTLRPGPDISKAADRFGRYLAGMAWIGFLPFLIQLRRLDHGLAWIFLVMTISWCGDTGGYFAGKYLGRHKLYPRISPKKTWEGVFGGMALATAGVFVVRAVGLPSLTPLDCVILGVVLCGAGVIGDLSESMLKRAFDVKDSGWIMPGHGGILDRIDSILFVTPLLYGYAVWVKGFGG